MCPEVAKYCKRAIIDYMAGNLGEYQKLANKAIELNKTEDKLVKCKYKINGQWVDAKIDFATGNIYSVDNKILRTRGKRYEGSNIMDNGSNGFSNSFS